MKVILILSVLVLLVAACTSLPRCDPEWQCSEWSGCTMEGVQIRTCTKNSDKTCSVYSAKPEDERWCKPTLDEIKWHSRDVDYKEYYRNNEDYQNLVVHFQGKILQVEESSEGIAFRLGTSNYNDVILVGAPDYNGERLLEDDIIDVWGTGRGLYTYETVLGSKETIPIIKSLYIQRLR